MDGREGVEAGSQYSHVDGVVPTVMKDRERDCGTARYWAYLLVVGISEAYRLPKEYQYSI
jgi:hypothetical protein